MHTMKRALISLSLLAAFAAPVLASGPVAKVNGKIIPASHAEILIASQVAQGRARTPELEALVREQLIRLETISQAALRKGIDKRRDVQTQLDLARQQIFINAYIEDFVNNLKISDADVRKEYDAINAAMGKKEYKARHILVETEGEARNIIERLRKGEPFAELAKVSRDPGSRNRGGELGWATLPHYVPPFSAALAGLTKGAFTQTPVRTDFGWHIIQLDDERDLTPPPFEEVRPQILQRLRQQAVENHVSELRKQARVE